jgi:hypothetical protein
MVGRVDGLGEMIKLDLPYLELELGLNVAKFY